MLRFHVKKSTWIFVFMIFFSSNSFASEMTVGDLQKFCSQSDIANDNACEFYIFGVVQGASLMDGSIKDKSGIFHEGKNTKICVPDNITLGAMEFIVKKAIGEDLMFYPQDKDLAAVSL